MLTIYGRKSSFNVQKVMWLIGELGIEHNHIQMGGSFGGLDRPDFQAMNPHGRVPVIDDGGTIVWESHAILRCLAARYGSGTFWSDDPIQRSRADQWIDWSLSALQPDFLVGIFWGYYRTPEPKRNIAAVEAAVDRTSQRLLLLDKLLEANTYLIGDHLSLADIPIGTHLFRYFNIDIRRPTVPNVERWYRLLQDRPAYRGHVMVPFGELYGRLAY
jgi:glutathione S-transferase